MSEDDSAGWCYLSLIPPTVYLKQANEEDGLFVNETNLKDSRKYFFLCRLEVISKYMATTHTGRSVSLTLYQLAVSISQDTVDMLW